ncbi:hypothetical protein [Pedobacter gandavensis]|uniref:Uncharacterized protein n=1 Tax=Pedobacter gandavensis TaxID=2679963 RepID=A0ABR6EQE9_9SPHI|nr:hypothetical protein [Pedobacter gandavensis]MBB2147460.1 hypothetical protein [Pedobacter gandavensis]
MKAKLNEKTKSDSIVKTSFKRRNYYFHPDEDFREDHTWDKAKSTELLNSEVEKKEASKTQIK